MLDDATEDDLATFDAEIATLKARIKALEAAREIVAEEVLNRDDKPKKPAKALAEAPAANGVSLFGRRPTEAGGTTSIPPDKLPGEICKYLTHEGPRQGRKIAGDLGVDFGRVLAALGDAELFEREGNTYTLTNAARMKYDPKQQGDD
jgi:hypothetical protein